MTCALAGCGSVQVEPRLGTMENPANSCVELLDEYGRQSRAYWLRHPDGKSPPLEVYCEQEILDGGWAMVFNSVRQADGTTAFWRIGYADRFASRGPAALDQDYYRGYLTELGLMREADGGRYSQVNRISRFARWTP